MSIETKIMELGEMLVNTETKVGDEDIVAPKAARQLASQMPRWSGDKPVRDVVWEAVQEFTRKDTNTEFSPKEIFALIRKKHPDFKVGTVHGQLTAGCPNHASYHSHSGNYKYYWWVRRGTYRLYNPESDKVEMREVD